MISAHLIRRRVLTGKANVRYPPCFSPPRSWAFHAISHTTLGHASCRYACCVQCGEYPDDGSALVESERRIGYVPRVQFIATGLFPPSIIDWSPDGQFIALGTATLSLLNVATDELLQLPDARGTLFMVLIPSGPAINGAAPAWSPGG